GSSYADSNVFF
nr:immunoglobulin light chain junction region [Macaca mulatta]MPO13704.1 immunoglobulin light chain junction region [Macaca mulatta]